MVAYSTSTSLEFKNIGGLLRIGVTGDASIASVMLSGNAENPLPDTSKSRKAIWLPAASISLPAKVPQFVSTSVTMTCTENVRLDANSPTISTSRCRRRNHGRITVTLTDSEGNTCLRQTHNSVSIERATLSRWNRLRSKKDKRLRSL